jgi:hypothetical protein
VKTTAARRLRNGTMKAARSPQTSTNGAISIAVPGTYVLGCSTLFCPVRGSILVTVDRPSSSRRVCRRYMDSSSLVGTVG